MKKLLLLMLCLVMAMSMLLTSCNKDDEGDNSEDGENQGEQGGTNENQGGNTGNEGGDQGGSTACQHVGTLICEKCFAPIYGALTLPEIPEINSIGVKIVDVDVAIADEDHPESNGTVTASLSEMYIAIVDGALTGYGHGSLTFNFKTPAHSDTVAANAYVENNVIYVYVDGVMFGDMDETITAAYSVDVMDVAQIRSAMEQLETYQPMIEQYAPEVLDWLENDLAPLFENVDLSALDGAALKIRENAAKLVNAFFTATKNNDGTTTLTFNFETIKTWNQALKDNKLDVIFDKIAGEGTFAKLEALSQDDKLYNFSVAELINYLETEQGIDLALLLDTIDLLVVKFMGEGATLETLAPMVGLELPEGFDLGTYLEDETLLALSVKDALVMLMADPEADTPLTAVEAVAQAKAMAANVFAMIKEMTAYDAIMGMMGGSAPEDKNQGAELMSGELEETDAMQTMVDQINAMLDMAATFFNFTITVDNSGNVSAINFSANIPFDDVAIEITASATASGISFNIAGEVDETSGGSMTITFTAEKITLTYDIAVGEAGVDVGATLEVIPNLTLTPDAEKLAAAKALLAKADGKITAANLKAALEKLYVEDSMDNRYKVLVDGDLVYFIEIDKSSDYNDNVKFEATVYDVTDFFALGVREGCTNCIVISPVFNAKRGSGSFPIDFAMSYAQILSLITVDHLTQNLIAEDHLEDYSDSVNFTYNTSTNEFVHGSEYIDELLRYGHTYVKDEALSTTPTNCLDVYYDYYVCSTCGDIYVEYDHQYHWYDSTSYELRDGVWHVINTCHYNPNHVLTEKFIVNPADLSYYGNVFDKAGGTQTGATYFIDGNDSSYTFSAKGDDYSSFNVAIYYKKDANSSYSYYGNHFIGGSYGSYEGQSASQYFGEGYSYYVVIIVNTIESDNAISFNIEKN